MPALSRRGQSIWIVRVERIAAILAFLLTAVGFLKPEMLAVSGLGFESRPAVDHSPTGSIAPIAPEPAHVFSGVLKPLRQKP